MLLHVPTRLCLSVRLSSKRGRGEGGTTRRGPEIKQHTQSLQPRDAPPGQMSLSLARTARAAKTELSQSREDFNICLGSGGLFACLVTKAPVKTETNVFPLPASPEIPSWRTLRSVRPGALCPYVNWRNPHAIYTIHRCSHVDLVREYYFQGSAELTEEAVFVYTFAYTHRGT